MVARLRGAGCVFAEDEATLLLDVTDQDLESLVARRVAGEPLEQVVGWAQFAGLRILLDPGVFVPRRRTELLARRAAALASPGDVVIDLCCGSGAISALVRAVVPSVQLHAVDRDARAVACARRNLGDVVHQGDLYDALSPGLRGRVDVLVANAPYVPSEEIALMPPEARHHEPQETLDGGPDGLDVLRRVIAGAPDWLASGGWLLFEVGVPQIGTAEEFCRQVDLVTTVAREEQLGATVVIAQRAP